MSRFSEYFGGQGQQQQNANPSFWDKISPGGKWSLPNVVKGMFHRRDKPTGNWQAAWSGANATGNLSGNPFAGSTATGSLTQPDFVGPPEAGAGSAFEGARAGASGSNVGPSGRSNNAGVFASAAAGGIGRAMASRMNSMAMSTGTQRKKDSNSLEDKMNTN